jgi:hypothetical protein
VTFNPGEILNSWTPDAAFSNRDDADLTLMYMTSNSISNIYPTNDPFYNTPVSGNVTRAVDGITTTRYLPQNDFDLLGCYDQHQFCNPANGNCTQLLSLSVLSDAMYSIGLNPSQLSTAGRILTNLPMTTIFNAVEGRGAAALLASQSVFGTTQVLPLPDNQWQLEVGNLFSVSLAKLQQGIIDYATGPSEPQLLKYQQKPTDPNDQAQCKNQKVKNQSTSKNFDLEALIIVIAVGAVLIALGYACDTFDRICTCGFGKRSKDRFKQKYRVRQWTIDGVLQLQRLAYTAAGVGSWEGKKNSVAWSLDKPFPGLDVLDPPDIEQEGELVDAGNHLAKEDVAAQHAAPLNGNAVNHVANNANGNLNQTVKPEEGVAARAIELAELPPPLVKGTAQEERME